MNFITNAMENWRMELTAKKQTLTEVQIQKGIFPGTSFLPLHFAVAKMHPQLKT